MHATHISTGGLSARKPPTTITPAGVFFFQEELVAVGSTFFVLFCSLLLLLILEYSAELTRYLYSYEVKQRQRKKNAVEGGNLKNLLHT